MAGLEGESTSEIDAPIEAVWELVADVERAPDWQGGLKSLIAVQHDDDGRVVLADVEIDGKVRTIKGRMRFTYDGPTRLSWVQETGDVKGVNGSWELVDLGGTTRARYHTEVDLGRIGLIIRGPAVGALREQLAGARASELKREVERGASS
ncbi:MAG TPA: SRPBCC family protein [Solirubrobacteraceae bacterium]|jgi:carbon monoxide dehydrogenase subunit G|nr:SRPBCC family protein [Solirubrobacteraceae bacterium]